MCLGFFICANVKLFVFTREVRAVYFDKFYVFAKIR